MFNPNLNPNNSHYLGERIAQFSSKKPPVYLEGVSYYKKYSAGITRVAPANLKKSLPAFEDQKNGSVYVSLKPMITLMRVLGIFPVGLAKNGTYQISIPLAIYSGVIFSLMLAYVGYINWDKVDLKKSAEGKFEEAVIDYLFKVYLLPIVMVPISWYESKKMAKVFTDWMVFEKYYKKVANKKLPVFQSNKPLLTTLSMPIISCGTMVVTHITMAHFKFLQVVPYCYINTITYVVGGIWYLYCDLIGKVATAIADDFQQALKHIGPSAKVAEYRSMWMLLSKVTRDVGKGSCYQLTFLCLYLFLIITLTIYGLLSQISSGFGVKDIGLTVTATFATAMLYFICDEAHYASNSVRVYFQKKLLLVELSWMNEDAQQEINMFLRATEMNPTEMSLGGFFDVNRSLFKSLLATMVTYLVVLLQFQISIPVEMDLDSSNSNTTSVASTFAPQVTTIARK